MVQRRSNTTSIGRGWRIKDEFGVLCLRSIAWAVVVGGDAERLERWFGLRWIACAPRSVARK